MAKTIIHVGYPKSASSWLQLNFFPTVRNFSYVPHKVARDILLLEHPFSFNAAQARQAVLDLAPDNRIISNEHLMGSFHNGGLHSLVTKEAAERLHATFPEAHIVIFLREQIDMIASCYRYYLLQGGTYSIERYLGFGQTCRGLRDVPGFDLAYLDYASVIDLYRGLFGPDQVSVYLFEQLRDDRENLLALLLSELGLEINLDEIGNERVNEGLRRVPMKMAPILNRLTRRKVIHKDYLLPLLPFGAVKKFYRFANRQRLAGPPVRAADLIRDELRQTLSAHYADCNRRVVEQVDAPLARFGYVGFA